MRIYHFSLIFAVFALMMLSAAAVSMEGTEEDEMSRACLDLVLDRASESAAAVLTKAHASGVYGQRDLAVETFFGALSAGLGLADGTPAMTMLRLYVPVIIVADEETLFVCFDDFETAPDGSERLIRKWSGPLERSAEGLGNTLEYYCNKHNETARRAGIAYEFFIPDEESDLFARSGAGTGFFALFQGYPSTRPGKEAYNGFSFAGTGIDDAEQYFINLSGEGLSSERFFHKKGCRHLSENSIMFVSRRKCAAYGAFECPECGY